MQTLLFDETLTIIMAKYFNYNNVFLVKNIVELLKNTRINNHIIKLKKNKQLLFGFIYNLRPVEVETLKIYIKTNLANGYIQLFKFSTKVLINSNAVAIMITWLHLSTSIPLSQPIAFTYQLIPNGLFPNTPNLIHLLLGIGFPTLHY